ncbi:amino acid ABC transporter membrane protein 2 (PAAT family) [Halopolyspora algeriensis]|uniref:Amino acid ABC transporter membrane protein 2 (PAAT family) n=1 Tax=Halopolyspora algeriensis TaxID=1500506 RepID=A0A368VQZ2_9ACTN|nr:amino acid ABC transporter permease [Halopolyspora algeriensis]RCW44024.1 amino acid ABC transporter membrane protein 2 (PAAT family) [Halopolyspora algeriensis]TQM53473.1 amino acid ABC transporter membrane protein 2 (PAAT family) [Halopolyspora algeriensis]
MTNSVLYEAPGPRAKRRARYTSIVVGVALLGIAAWAVAQLAAAGQFTMNKWGPLVDPSHEYFAALWNILGQGLVNTLQAAALSIALSLVIGTAMALTRITSAPWYRWAVVGVIELLRGIPVVIAIFFAARVLPELGIELPLLWYLVIGLTAYNSVIIAEIVRAGILSLPRGQSEAAYALGMRRSQVLLTVLLPQAFRTMLPALISQLVVVLKDTSLGYVISYPELVQEAEIAIQNLNNPIQIYFVVAVVFIAINYSLSRLAVFTERRLSRGRQGPSRPARPHRTPAATGNATGGGH